VAEECRDLAYIPLERISSAVLQRAPIGSWLGVTVPDGTAMREPRFHCYAFDYPAFAQLFTLLRQTIGKSVPTENLLAQREAADG
jgi:hypothetical protein